jgi:hypothetical protein
MKGEDFMKNVFPTLKDEKIVFAYLDNFDYIYDEIRGKAFVNKQIQLYSTYNIQMNNENSKKAHLEQAQHVHNQSADDCFILFDDTFLNKKGEYDGKGTTGITWLQEHGWKIVEVSPRGTVPWKGYVLMQKSSTGHSPYINPPRSVTLPSKPKPVAKPKVTPKPKPKRRKSLRTRNLGRLKTLRTVIASRTRRRR